MFGSGHFHPEFRNDLFSIPFSFLQVKLSQLCHIFGAKEKSPAAFGDALGAGFPEIAGNAKGRKKPWLQILGEGLSGALCDDSRQDIGIQAVVDKGFTGSAADRSIQIASQPVIS